MCMLILIEYDYNIKNKICLKKVKANLGKVHSSCYYCIDEIESMLHKKKILTKISL